MKNDKNKSKLSFPETVDAKNNKPNTDKLSIIEQTKTAPMSKGTATKNLATKNESTAKDKQENKKEIPKNNTKNQGDKKTDSSPSTKPTIKKQLFNLLNSIKPNQNKTKKKPTKKFKPAHEQQTPRLEDSIDPNDPCYTDSKAFTVMQELIKEQRSQRRWRLFRNYLIAFVFISLIFSSLFTVNEQLNEVKAIYKNPTAFQQSSFIEYDHIAVIPLKGIIMDGGTTDAIQMHKLLQKAFSNPAAKTIFIDANSPGGSPVQSALIFDAISRLKKQYPKPIYAIVSDICASGCYYALAGVDKIFVNASSIIGSIGVRLESFDLRGLLEKAGAKQRLLTAGENKALLNPFGEFPESQREYLQELIDKTHIEFVDVVIEGRGKKINSNNPVLFSGLIWNGRESIKLGLSDDIGDLVSVSEAIGIKTLEHYKPYEGFLEQILHVFNRFRFDTQQHLKATVD